MALFGVAILVTVPAVAAAWLGLHAADWLAGEVLGDVWGR